MKSVQRVREGEGVGGGNSQSASALYTCLRMRNSLQNTARRTLLEPERELFRRWVSVLLRYGMCFSPAQRPRMTEPRTRSESLMLCSSRQRETHRVVEGG